MRDKRELLQITGCCGVAGNRTPISTTVPYWTACRILVAISFCCWIHPKKVFERPNYLSQGLVRFVSYEGVWIYLIQFYWRVMLKLRALEYKGLNLYVYLEILGVAPRNRTWTSPLTVEFLYAESILDRIAFL